MAGSVAWFRVLCLFGLLLSCYALYVEHKASVTPGFEALCDIGPYISCSKVTTDAPPWLWTLPLHHCVQVFTSEWGHVFFGLPNALLGKIYVHEPPPLSHSHTSHTRTVCQETELALIRGTLSS